MKNLMLFLVCSFLFISFCADAQDDPLALKATRLFDGEKLIANGVVVIHKGKIISAGNSNEVKIPSGTKTIDYGNKTIMPGMIEGHSHMFLHPYNETPWNDQVLIESIAERSIRAAKHAEATLMAGFTTARDLGSEGAGYADVGLRESIEKGIIPGPRLLVAGPAIVTTGSYGPKGFAEHVNVPLGANPADGTDDLIREVRRQIGGGADLIKVYADYRWGPNKTAMPTFTLEELKLIVEITESSGRQVVAHAASEEGMQRATLAGVSTIEHGDGGTEEVFQLMKEHNVALCPTLAAGDAISQYRGWKKGEDPEPERISNKKKSFAAALNAGVTIVAGGDVGVFTHGDNVRELEMMVEYGMSPIDVMKSVTSINAAAFGLSHKTGTIKKGLSAELIIVDGNPTENISDLRKIETVIQYGVFIKR